MTEQDNTYSKISYRVKKITICPVCEESFHREELHMGGGRMNAGDLSDELHRKYIPTQKYGPVYPLIYPISVCPKCYYATFPRHFESISDDMITVLKKKEVVRKNFIHPVLKDVDFEQPRTLKEGIASYYLAAICYEDFDSEISPTFLRGLCFLRAGWLTRYLHKTYPEENYNYMARIFLRKAAFFYGEIIHKKDTGIEHISNVPHYGPDLDNNYGYDGVLYLAGVLQLKYGQTENLVQRVKILKFARSAVSQMVGIGQTSRAKPSALIDKGRSLHRDIKKELSLIEHAS